MTHAATPSQTVGPFFHFGLTPDDGLGIVTGISGQEPLRLVVRVADGDGLPVADAAIEIWHTGDREPGASGPPLSGFGRLPTNGDGWCEFETVRPGRGPEADRAAHVNLCLFARGLLRHLQTRIYFAGDPDLAADALLALVPEDRRQTLLAHPDPGQAGRWVFDLRLQGQDETVFFDV
jgi:protocatechuate 3,4-dioxygenase alpha subunit